jgi:hypothetical protein
MNESFQFLKNIILVFRYRKTASSNYHKFKEMDSNWREFMNWIDENKNVLKTIIG